MKHVLVLAAMLITSTIVAVGNVILAKLTGFDFFGLTFWFIIPAGAILAGMAAAGGGILAARLLNHGLTKIDAFMMVGVSAATMVLYYYLDYYTLVLDDGRRARDLIGFWDYVDLVLTSSHMRIGRGARDIGQVGAMGYWLAGLEFIGFMAGGFSAFALAARMPRCTDCGAYLRKLKSRKTEELTREEAEAMIDQFNNGDVAEVAEVLRWKPPERTFAKQDKRAVITHELQGCPKCMREQLKSSINVFNGEEWKEIEALESRRDLVLGLSFRQHFE